MPDTLHNVQRMVNPHIACGALPLSDSECNHGDMRLREIRKAKGLSQKALGEMIDKDAATVNRAEKMASSAKLETYIRCADALGVTLEDIFGPDFSEAELQLIEAFRAMPEEKRQRTAELLDLVKAPPQP